MFTKTLSISTKRVNTALCKMRSDKVTDNHGIHRKGKRRIPLDVIENVKKHISNFPRYKSHYCRKESGNAEYLPAEMTVAKMFELYEQEYASGIKVSKSWYRHILCTHFNLRQKKLKKDTCKKCDEFNVKMKMTSVSEEDKQAFEKECNLHQSEAQNARNQMTQDIKMAKEVNNVETLTYDLQKTLPLPRFPTNIIYYKRQICVYNSGVYSAKKNRGYFYVWVEGTAGRGAQEVGSCLRKHLLSDISHDITELNLWSDSCGGQNRNIKIVLLLNTLFDDLPHLNTIRLKYLVSGHSYLENDSHFGDVELALKYQQYLYTLEDYIHVMETCRKKKEKFCVSVMDKEDFKSTSKIENGITNRKKDLDDQKVNWLKVREIRLDRSKPMILQMRMTFDENSPYSSVDIKKKKKGRPSSFFIHQTLFLFGLMVNPSPLRNLTTFNQ